MELKLATIRRYHVSLYPGALLHPRIGSHPVDLPTLPAVVTLAMGEGYIFVLTAFFVAMWLISAQLFRKATRDETGVAAAQAV